MFTLEYGIVKSMMYKVEDVLSLSNTVVTLHGLVVWNYYMKRNIE